MTDNIETCPICSNNAVFSFKKKSIDYYQCSNCYTLFSEYIDNSGMVGGQAEIPRNVQQNPERIERLKVMCGGKFEGVNVLDFGAGTGYFVDDLNAAGFNADGYDAYNPKFDTLPQKDKYDICTMVEVAEHLSKPFVEYDCIFRSLKKGGLLYIETSFVNVAWHENIPLDQFDYVAPQAGHCTIHSWHGLDLLLALKNFTPAQHLNRHCRLYKRN
jgi:2-polyprenyl-3-methyl-5-hydroxy-6-metoxy-1,4-benzoquinol methylase